MSIIKIRSVFLILCLMFLVSGIAIAKDNKLQEDMIELEQAYIPALFLTSQVESNPNNIPNVAQKAKGAMVQYAIAWEGFSEKYSNYRPTWRNWISYMFHVQGLVDEAEALVEQDEFQQAHEEELELVRTTMRELRERNGFPKFITDELTAFHSIMGEIIKITKTTEINDATIAVLDELYNEASHAWFKVEKNIVEQDAWGLDDDKMNEYYQKIIAERYALDDFDDALSSGNADMIKDAASGLKPPQTRAYLILGGM